MGVTGTALAAFADEVGTHGHVVPVGGGTHWAAVGEGRRVRAPAGVVAYEPAEMTVRVRAGTTVAELDAVLAEHGQMVPLDPADPTRATVGGVLAEGVSGIRRLRWGPVRDTVLEVRYVSAEGRVVKSGGPVVKNVSGFDLCRLMVGSRGTLGVLAEVVLRVQRMALELGDDLAELDINPLMVLPQGQGAVALDALAVCR
jgi:FAD/FMN-containing dehydrogenase